MDYHSIFDPVPWPEVGTALVQTFVIYWVVMLGLKLVGRRVFGEMGPQDLILLMLIAEATDVGLTPEKGGFWATLASVTMILLIGGVIERIPALREWMDASAVLLVRDGEPIRSMMEQYQVSDEDLRKTAHEYGLDSISSFERMYLEGDGKITGVVRKTFESAGNVHS